MEKNLNKDYAHMENYLHKDMRTHTKWLTSVGAQGFGDACTLDTSRPGGKATSRQILCAHAPGCA
jgi:hypothetical protein